MKAKHTLLIVSSLLMLSSPLFSYAHSHHDPKLAISVNLNQKDPGVSFSMPTEHRHHHSHSYHPQWINVFAGGRIPAGAVVGGYEHRSPLYICRGNYRGGMHPGKLVAGNCNITWGGREISLSNYQLLLSREELSFVPTRHGRIPEDAVQGGYENGEPLYICQTRYHGGMHPGKVVGSNCNIGWGGQEILSPDFNVLVD